MKTEEAFNLFLNDFIPRVKKKSLALAKASWELETKGSKDAAMQVAILSKEVKLLYNNEENYKQLLSWKKEGQITDTSLLRILNLLIKSHKVNLVPAELIEDIAQKEANLAITYVNFRVKFEGRECTENDLVDILKTEKDVERRKAAWNATKEIGVLLAPQILALVKKRNQLAHRLGYSDFYEMRLDLTEVDKKWLFEFLNEFEVTSRKAYLTIHKEIETKLSERYKTSPTSIGPWAWAEPFSQEDPLSSSNLDSLVEGVDIVKASEKFFNSIGFEVDDIIKNSDLFERKGKNQHAFCTSIDREKDIRILTNIRPNIRWLETTIHELGHAVYEKGYDPKLHWYLKVPPHMITTEAIALITGRQAYDKEFLKDISSKENLDDILTEAKKSHTRRQVIFSRWVLVMVHFEAALYANPEQDLNSLWWSLVQKYQKVCPSSHRGEKADWACKMHIGLAPIYYHSYLLGEFFASMIKDHFEKINNTPSMYKHPGIAKFLNEKLFSHGDLMRWDRLIQSMLGQPLTYKPWVEEFCNNKDLNEK